MSLDGFVAGASQSVRDPLGIGGMRLREWVFPLQPGERCTVSKARDRARRAAAGNDVSLAGGASAAQQYLAAGSWTCEAEVLAVMIRAIV